jgi:hypothetical protein
LAQKLTDFSWIRSHNGNQYRGRLPTRKRA